MTQYKRRRKSRTDYNARLNLIKSGKLRLVARMSLKNIILQIIEYKKDGDVVLIAAHSNELKRYGWLYSKTNISAAYLLGLLVAIKAKKKNLKEAIFDSGLKKAIHSGVLFAVLNGAVNGGLKIPHNPDIFPTEARINGEHVAKYAKMLNNEEYAKRFGNYAKLNLKPEDMKKKFDEAKNNILRS